MIKSFKLENYFSVLEPQEISFAISKKDMLDDSSFKSPCGNLLNNVISVIGNNASGKTNILKGLSYILSFASSSYQKPEPNNFIRVTPHKLANKKDTKFEIIFENNSKEYQYIIELNPEMVTYEFLGVKKQRGYSCLYEVKRKENSFSIEKWSLSKLNDNDKNRFSAIETASFFSFLISTGHLPAIGLSSFVSSKGNLGFWGKTSIAPEDAFFSTANALNEDEKRKEMVLSQIKEFGLGIDDFNFVKIDNQQSTLDNISQSTTTQKDTLMLVVHKTKDKEFMLPIFSESDGTQHAVHLLNYIYPVLKTGGILIYDEIEDSLHPYVIKKLIKIFANKEVNRSNAQLIFTTHQPFLLDDRTKTQIYLVEKNENLETELFRLDEVEGVRNTDNYCSKYLSGAYGGVSEMRWF